MSTFIRGTESSRELGDLGYDSSICKYDQSYCTCLGALEESGFGLLKISQFKKWFNDKSVAQLAQAGEYIGVDAVQELTRFITKNQFSFEYVPISESFAHNPTLRQCSVTMVVPRCATFENDVLGSIDYNFAFKILFSIERYSPRHDTRAEILVHRLNYFLPESFLSVYGEHIRTATMAEQVCNVMKSNCPQTYAKNFPDTLVHSNPYPYSINISCVDKMFALEYNLTGVLDGNTFGCRVLHSAMASKNSYHCPHISFIPDEDINGNIVCQESRGINPVELFTKEELEVIQNYKSKFIYSKDTHSLGHYFEGSSCTERYGPNLNQGGFEFPVIIALLVTIFILQFYLIAPMSLIDCKKILASEVEHHVNTIKAGNVDQDNNALIEEKFDDNCNHISSKEESHTNELGQMVNKIIDISTEMKDGWAKSWMLVILVSVVTLISIYASLIPFVLLVVEPSIVEPSKVNMILIDESSALFEEKTTWSMTNSHPIYSTEIDEFFTYLTILIWIFVNCIGFGLEIFFFEIFLRDGWDEAKHENKWRLAQFVFPVGALTSVGLAATGNYLAILVLIPCLWKFGFPETVVTMHLGLFDSSLTKLNRLCELCDAIGLVWHHSSASLIICLLVTGLVTPNKAILDASILLCAQHFIILLRYWFESAYNLIQLFLEVWLQWTILSNLESYIYNNWMMGVAALVLIYSHWIWFFSVILRLVMKVCDYYKFSQAK